MVDRTERTYARLQQCIHQAAVIIQASLVNRSRARRLDSRPRCGEAVALLIEPLEDGDVLFIAMILIACNIPGGASSNFAYGMREAVPVGFAFAIEVPRPFNLVSGRGHSPKEFAGKAGPVAFGKHAPTGNRFLRGEKRTGNTTTRKRAP